MHERVKIFSYHVTNVFDLIQQIRYNYDKPRGGIKNITLYAKFRNLNFFCYEMYNSFLDIFARIHQYGASMIYSKVTRNSKKWKLLKRLRCFSTITFQMSVLLPLNLFDFFFFFFFSFLFQKTAGVNDVECILTHYHLFLESIGVGRSLRLGQTSAFLSGENFRSSSSLSPLF